MKHSKTMILMGAAALALTLPVATARGGGRGGAKQGGQVSQTALSEAEAQALTFMWEEEKLARDVYLSLFDMWGTKVFSNISSAEQTHMDAIKGLLDKYGLPTPDLEEGEFNEPELQDLYDMLVVSGAESLTDALLVGGLIEEVDIEDLVLAIDGTDRADLQRVYGNLMSGSESHLRAFVGLFEDETGEDYLAQWLTQEEVDAILGED